MSIQGLHFTIKFIIYMIYIKTTSGAPQTTVSQEEYDALPDEIKAMYKPLPEEPQLEQPAEPE